MSRIGVIPWRHGLRIDVGRLLTGEVAAKIFSSAESFKLEAVALAACTSTHIDLLAAVALEATAVM